MATIDLQTRAKLIAALEESDAQVRDARADRIIWMGQHNSKPAIILGNAATLAVMQEAEEAFRDGHFISVLLLSLSVIEHDIVDDLVVRGHASFDRASKQARLLARKHKTLDGALLDRIDKLWIVRNPFVHLRPGDDPNTYGNRYIARRIHPVKLLEEDAKEAIQVMFLVLSALLKVIRKPGTG